MESKVFELPTRTDGDRAVGADVARALRAPREPGVKPRRESWSNMRPSSSAWANRSNLEPERLDNSSNMAPRAR